MGAALHFSCIGGLLFSNHLLAIDNHDALVVIAHLLAGKIEHTAILALAVILHAVDARSSYLAVNLDVRLRIWEGCEINIINTISHISVLDSSIEQ